MEIEYVTEEPEIYDPNYIFFKRIFEAFKVTTLLTGLSELNIRIYYSSPFLAVMTMFCGICFNFALMLVLF